MAEVEFIEAAIIGQTAWPGCVQGQHEASAAAADIQGVRELFDEGPPMGSLWYSNHFGVGSP